MTNSISALRQELRSTLGTHYPRYMKIMREWFANRHNRQDWEFDMPFLSGRARELHNNLMLAILKQCMSPHFERRQATASVVQQAHILPENGNGLNKKNVMTLHAAPEQESTSELPVYFQSEPSSRTVAPPPPVTVALSMSEEDGDEEEGTEDSKGSPLFFLGLRKVSQNGISDLPPPVRTKTDQRYPITFLNELFNSGRKCKNDILANVTHSINVKKHLDAEPELRQYFNPKQNLNDPFLSSNATLPGKVLLKAWEFGIRSIDPHIIPMLTRAAQDRVSLIIRELIKERKSFRLKRNGQIQFGEFHENPYLFSKHHIPTSATAERRPYSTILVDPITLPPDSELLEKNEQVAALRGATSIDPPSRTHKISLMDVYHLFKSHPHLNLGGVEGQEILEKLLINSSGSLEPSHPSEKTDLDDFEEGQLMPLVSY